MNYKDGTLKLRIEEFIVSGIKLSGKLPRSIPNLRIIPQIIDSITSVGANYNEACEAESSKDFVHKMKIALKETKETNYWLRILYRTNIDLQKDIEQVGRESLELVKIFSSILFKFKNEKI